MKKTVFWFALIAMMFSSILVFAEGNTTPTRYFYDGKWHDYPFEETYLSINGEKIESDMPPIIFNDRAVVPARAVFEKLGATVLWDESKSQVSIVMGNTNLLLTINDTTAIVNKEKYQMEIPPKIINSRTMIPVRFVAESLGMKVDWIPNERLIAIESKPVVPGNTTPPVASKDISIKDVQFSSDGKRSRVTISSDLPINEYSTFELDNNPRVVIDIQNAVLSVKGSELVTGDGNLYKIRYAQYSKNPNITRIVIDLNTWTSYDIEESADKKQLYIDFQKQFSNVSDVEVTSSNDENIVLVKMDKLQKPNIVPDMAKGQVIIDIPMSTFAALQKNIDARGELVKSVQVSQLNENTVRVAVVVNKQVSFKYEEVEEGFKVAFFKPTYKNFYYYNKEKPRFVIDKEIIDYGKHMDDKTGVFTLSIPYFEVNIGSGTMYINDEYFEYVDIVRNDDKIVTEITFYPKKRYVYNISAGRGSKEMVIEVTEVPYVEEETIDEPNNNADMPELDPRAKDKIVVIDPGHGGTESGATYKDEVVEKDLNLDISLKLYKLLKDAGVKVYMTRDTDKTVGLYERADFANNLNATLLISVHNNSMGVDNPSVNGTTTLYHPNCTGDGYGISGKRLAEIAQEEMVKRLGTKNLALQARKDLAVLNRAKMPAIIAEVAFITNPSDREKLKTDEFRQKAAEALCAAAIKALNECVLK
ncbi:MAG: AMIN domain-containing protein [Clostridiaceae bacterium]|nr:AMIN domain-containing protein [Clostridiaceae bacterium]